MWSFVPNTMTRAIEPPGKHRSAGVWQMQRPALGLGHFFSAQATGTSALALTEATDLGPSASPPAFARSGKVPVLGVRGV